VFAWLAAIAVSAQAVPIVFSEVQLEVTAIATTDGPAGFQSFASPPETAPIAATADSIGATDIATAGAIGGHALVSTSADVTAISGIVNAIAVTQFSGSFLSDAQLALSIDFTPFTFASGSGSAETTLFMTVVSGGSTVFQDFVAGSRQFEFFLVPGNASRLTLELVSQATAGFPLQGSGGAASLGVVAFEGVSAIPEPATWLFMVLGGGLVTAVARRARCRQRT
jgi:PEP-CTERM motif